MTSWAGVYVTCDVEFKSWPGRLGVAGGMEIAQGLFETVVRVAFTIMLLKARGELRVVNAWLFLLNTALGASTMMPLND